MRYSGAGRFRRIKSAIGALARGEGKRWESFRRPRNNNGLRLGWGAIAGRARAAESIIIDGASEIARRRVGMEWVME